MANKVNLADIDIGDPVAEMHLHLAGFGIMKGWDVSQPPFEITEEMYNAMRSQLPGNINRGVGNKMAQVVGINEAFDDSVAKVLVIYSYDHRYYVATLSYPKQGATL